MCCSPERHSQELGGGKEKPILVSAGMGRSAHALGEGGDWPGLSKCDLGRRKGRYWFRCS